MSDAAAIRDDIVDGAPYLHFTEDGLQDRIHTTLQAAGWIATREWKLSDGKSRIDIVIPAGLHIDRKYIGIEVKVASSIDSVRRQLLRYAQCREITELILVTTKPTHSQLAGTFLNDKPLTVVSLLEGGL